MEFMFSVKDLTLLNVINERFSDIHVQVPREYQLLVFLLTNHAEFASASCCHKSPTHVLVLFGASHSTFEGFRVVSDLCRASHTRPFVIKEGEIQPMNTRKCQMYYNEID